MVAYGVIVVVPLLIIAWYWMMYSDIGRSGITGGEPMGSGPDTETEPEA